MKKFKKLLAGLLTGAMLLGSMSVSAFAADAATTTPTSVPVIDESKEGSITIHKYEYNGTGGVTGTGETTDESKVPAEAKKKPLQGAGFTIYKVADVNDLKTYYSKTPTDLPLVSDYVANDKIIDSKIKDGFTPQQQITNENGETTFSNLDLGFYVVIETKTPDKVTTPAKPFLVSIPMTVKSGDNWLYDVNVYPKNKTTYAGVTLEKKGKGDTPLQGVKFVLQKQNGTSWTNVTINENTNAALDLTTNANGQIIVDGLSQGTYRFIETDRGTNDGYIMDGATTYQFVVGADGKVTYGSDPAAANITIPVKNEKPDMSKMVQKKEGTWGQDADYSVGDLVPYQIKVSVPENIDKLKTFTLTDTPTNLKDDVTSVKVTDATGNTTIPATATPDGNGFTIDFTSVDLTAYAGKDIIVTYNAELLSTAETTTKGNPNTATLEYSNKILPKNDDGYNPNKPNENPSTDKIQDTATVYSFTIQVLKTADSAEGTALKDVTFEVYKEVDERTNSAITSDVAKKKGLASDSYWLKIGDLKTDDNGMAEQKGLSNGIYYLVETKTNKDYNLLKAPVEVKLSITYTTTTKTEYKTVNNVKTLVKHEVTSREFKNGENTFTGTLTQNVINKKGFELPLTGGMGTVLFSVIGLALVLAGVVVITASRKKTAK